MSETNQQQPLAEAGSSSRVAAPKASWVDFGPNVIIFDSSMPMADIQAKTKQILDQQQLNQFGTERIAFFFKPGNYTNLNVEIGYYTTVHGLGHLPGDVTITGGGVQSTGSLTQGLALNNFWRGVENLTINPTSQNLPITPKNQNINMWAVSQATYMRRVHITGVLFLCDYNFDGQGNYSSGGFIADSVVDNVTISRTQQQFLTRNTAVGDWPEGVWNMVFVGDLQAPTAPWPDRPFTVVDKTPVIREKPYLAIDGNGEYTIQVPALKRDSQGPDWTNGVTGETSIPISQCYIAKSATDGSNTLNDALNQGKHLILTPGIYHLDKSLQVTHPNTVILGLGMATLTPDNGTPAMIISDVDGVSVCGILFDAGAAESTSILIVGENPSGGGGVDHSSNPTALYDLSCRVGGSAPVAKATNCFLINSDHVLLDNVWLWRADHGTGVDWEAGNPSDNGVTVNGADVTAYGLFVEHFKKTQTVWNGERGSTYFYQSEIPYDVPNQASWQQGTEKGYPSYKVADGVTQHIGRGLGVYCNFLQPDVQLDNAIETPEGSGISMLHMVTVWLGVKPGTAINHIINGKGDPVYDYGEHFTARLTQL